MSIEHNSLSHGIIVIIHSWFCALLYSSKYEVICALFWWRWRNLCKILCLCQIFCFVPSPWFCFCKEKEKTKYSVAKMKNSAHVVTWMTHFSQSHVILGIVYVFGYFLNPFSSVSIWLTVSVTNYRWPWLKTMTQTQTIVFCAPSLCYMVQSVSRYSVQIKCSVVSMNVL